MENNEPKELINSSYAEASQQASNLSSGNIDVDINSLSREDLVNLFSDKMNVEKVDTVSRLLENIKKRFDSLTEQLQSNKFDKFIKDGGLEENYVKENDNADNDMQTAYSNYRSRLKSEQNANAVIKKDIIAQLEQMLNNDEDITNNKKKIHELIDKWRQTGNVPYNEANEVNSNYKKLTDRFYEFLRISHEMRELDLKRNYDEKVKLCEQAEELAQSTLAIKAFRQIQELHIQWKQIGATPNDVREALWNRFKAATNIVNDRFHKFIDEAHDKEKVNYEAKLAINSEIEEILKGDFSNSKSIDAAVKKVTELQAKWKTIGIVPKSVNSQVYSEFRKLCDEVFNRKREFYKSQNATFQSNLEKKQQLCEQAEAMQDSTEWKDTYDKYVSIQKKWKQIGPVPHKVSDSIWKRFKTACDHFFENREKFFGTQDVEREANLVKKTAILEELKATQMPDNTDEIFKILREFQQRWNSIGSIPNKKREVHTEFTTIINNLYDKCASDDAEKNMQRFKAKMELLKNMKEGQSKLNQERNHLINKLRQVENDVKTLENNIGFLSNSKNSDGLKNEITKKINNSRSVIKQLNDKLDIIDKMML